MSADVDSGSVNSNENPHPHVVSIRPENSYIDMEQQPQQPYDEDDHSGEIREYNGVFEGPEKTLGELLIVRR